MTDILSTAVNFGREELAKIMANAHKAEQGAVAELHNFLTSPEAKAFIDKIKSIHGLTVPGSHHDQILMSLLNVIGSIQAVAERTVSTILRVESALKIPADVPIVTEQALPLPKDPPLPAEPTLQLMPDMAIPADTAGGEVS